MPELPKSAPTDLESIVLGGELDAKTVRKIIDALNVLGKFPGLAQFFRDIPDSSIDVWLGFISEFWYEDADRKGSLVDMLRSQPADYFKRAVNSASAWESRGKNSGVKKFLQSAAGHSRMPSVVGTWLPVLVDLPLERGLHPAVPISFETAQLLAHEFQIFQETSRREEFVSSLGTLLQPSFADAFGKSASRLEAVHGKKVWESISNAVTALLAPVGAIIPADNLVDLTHLLNRPSEGLFVHLRQSLSQSVAIRQLIDQFLAKKIRALAAFTLFDNWNAAPFSKDDWVSLADSSSANFEVTYRRLFDTFYKSLRTITVLPNSGPADIRFERLSTLTLNSLALAEWIQTLATKNRTAFSDLPALDFQKKLFERPLEQPPFAFEVMVFSGTAWQLSESVEKQLRKVAKNEFVDDLKKAIVSGRFSSFAYEFEASSSAMRPSIERGVSVIDWTRPLALTNEAAGTLLNLIGLGGPISLSYFESSNFLESIVVWYRDQPSYQSVEKTLRYLLVDLGFGKMTFEDRKLIESLWANTQWQDWIREVLPKLETFTELLDGNRHEGSGLEWFYYFLQGVTNDDLPSLLNVISNLSDWDFFNPKVFPTAMNVLKDPARFLWALERLTLLERSVLLLPRNINTIDVTELYVDQIGSLHLGAFLFNVFSGEAPFPSIDVSTAHKKWLKRFASNGGVESVGAVLNQTPRASALKAIRDIETAVSDGTAAQMLTHLRAVRDPRFRRGVETLLLMDRNGELREVLALLRWWLT